MRMMNLLVNWFNTTRSLYGVPNALNLATYTMTIEWENEDNTNPNLRYIKMDFKHSRNLTWEGMERHNRT